MATANERRPSGRVLGLDLGERRIGVAISDPEQRIAVPLRTIEREHHMETLSRLVDDEGVDTVVLGLPLSLSGEDTAQTRSTRAYGAELEQLLGVRIVLWDERLSSSEASRLAGTSKGRRGRGRRPQVDVDAMAATVVLQSYLDSRRVAG
jgi:putative Holliday junction resolvase